MTKVGPGDPFARRLREVGVVLRAAVVGTGFAGRQHVDALRRIAGVEVAAVVGSSPKRAEAAAAALGVQAAYADLDAALSFEQIDVVHVCLPNDLHAPIVEAALAAGRHVVCEKPLARDADEAARVVLAAERAGTVAVLCHNYRYMAQVWAMREVRERGELGRVHTIRGGYLQDWLLDPADTNWRVDPRRGGAGRALGDIGTHWFDLAEWVSGSRITSVLAEIRTVHDRRGGSGSAGSPPNDGWEEVRTEDVATILLRFSDDVAGVAVVSQVAPGHKNDLELSLDGTAASATWRQEQPDELRVGHQRTSNEIRLRGRNERPGWPTDSLPAGHVEGWSEGLRSLLAATYAAIQRGVVPTELPSFRDGLHYLEIVEACLKSAERGGWVAVRDRAEGPRETAAAPAQASA